MRLRNLIQEFARANPNTRFIIIGHSQGGLIGLHALGLAARPGIVIDTFISLDGALGGAPQFEDFIASAFLCWGKPASQNMSTLWSTASDHNRQGTTARFLGQTNADLVTAAQENGVMVVTIGDRQDCVWNPTLCEPIGNIVQDNTSTQIIENADVPAPLLNLGGFCIIDPRCISDTHSRVLEHLDVLQIIEQVVGSPTVP